MGWRGLGEAGKPKQKQSSEGGRGHPRLASPGGARWGAGMLWSATNSSRSPRGLPSPPRHSPEPSWLHKQVCTPRNLAAAQPLPSSHSRQTSPDLPAKWARGASSSGGCARCHGRDVQWLSKDQNPPRSNYPGIQEPPPLLPMAPVILPVMGKRERTAPGDHGWQSCRLNVLRPRLFVFLWHQ